MFSATNLSIGNADLCVSPVHDDEEELGELLSTLTAIRGVDHASVVSVDGGRAHLTIHSSFPLALEQEVRTAFGSRFRSSRVIDETVEVSLVEDGLHDVPNSDHGAAGIAGSLLFAPPGMRAGVASAVDGLSDLSIIVFDLEQRYVAHLGGMLARFGKQFTLIRGKRAREIVRPELWERLSVGYTAALRGEEIVIEFSAAGHGTTYESSFGPLVGDDDRIVGGIVTTRPTTKDDRLEELRTVLELLFENPTIGYGLLSAEGLWVRLNDSLRGVLGLSVDDATGTPFSDAVSGQELGAAQAAIADLREGRREACELEASFRMPHGGRTRHQIRLTAVRHSGHQCAGIVAQVLLPKT